MKPCGFVRVYHCYGGACLHIKFSPESTDSYTTSFFILKNASMHYFNKPFTGNTARVTMDAVRAHLGTQFISSRL